MTKKFLRHPVVKNAISLLTVQIARYILPLITIPYLARILSPQEWGLVIFAQVCAQWFEMMLDYGFNLSATREIARNRDNQQQVTEIVSGIIEETRGVETRSFAESIYVALYVRVSPKGSKTPISISCLSSVGVQSPSEISPRPRVPQSPRLFLEGHLWFIACSIYIDRFVNEASGTYV